MAILITIYFIYTCFEEALKSTTNKIIHKQHSNCKYIKTLRRRGAIYSKHDCDGNDDKRLPGDMANRQIHQHTCLATRPVPAPTSNTRHVTRCSWEITLHAYSHISSCDLYPVEPMSCSPIKPFSIKLLFHWHIGHKWLQSCCPYVKRWGDHPFRTSFSKPICRDKVSR